MNIQNKIYNIFNNIYVIPEEELENLNVPSNFTIEDEDLEAAWGYGMTENGCILGAGNIIEKFTDGSEDTPNLERILKINHPSVEEMIDACRTAREVLGMSEYLLVHGFDISQYKELILECIFYELEGEMLDKWISPVEREIELKKFKNKIENL